MEEDIRKALVYATAIKRIYIQIMFFNYTNDLNRAQKMQTDLEFVLNLEKEHYQKIINKDLKKYLAYLRRKYSISLNMANIILTEDCFQPYLRVYFHLEHLEESLNYYNEFNLAPIIEEQNYKYLQNKLIVKNLYFMTYYALENHYNHSTFAIRNLRYILAFLFPEIEEIFWQQQNISLYIPSQNEYTFGSCLDIRGEEMVDFYAVKSLEQYFGKMLNANEKDIQKMKDKKLLHEFYIRFLFFLINNKQVKQEYIFLISQYVSITDHLKDIWIYCLEDIKEDDEYIESFKKNFPK